MTDHDNSTPPSGSDAPAGAGAAPARRPPLADRAADYVDGLSGLLGTLDLAWGLVNAKASKITQIRVLGHHVAAAHVMMMDLCAEAREFLGHADPDAIDGDAHKRSLTAARLAGAGARFMERIRLGVLALNGLRPDGGGPGGGERNIIHHMHWGDKEETRQYKEQLEQVLAAGGSGMDMPKTEKSYTYVEKPGSKRNGAPGGRGRLRNGNRSGDFLTAAAAVSPPWGTAAAACMAARAPVRARPKASPVRAPPVSAMAV